MSLLNVRLTKLDQDAVRILKRSGVEISAVVRDALRREAERHRPRTPASTANLLAEIFIAFPEPTSPKRGAVDVHDRRKFAKAFRDHLRAKRSR